MKNYIYSICGIAAVCVATSVIFDIAYIHTSLGLLVWSIVGHFITLDDDMPGGWDNPDGDERVWYGSLCGLAVKLILLVALGTLYIKYPYLAQFGS